ncbi:MAG: glycosyltransferase, partial [Clostridia bacterium]|nr:glycosyltransferase [Clostridia bacterium]
MDKLIFIPAYKPDHRLPELCSKLSGSYSVLVVDDGSGKEFDGVFESTAEYAKVLRYEKNRGKGGALKYGYSRIPEL